MYKLTFTAVARLRQCSSRSPRPPPHTTARAASRIVKTGTCSVASHSKLKAKTDDGRLETEFEVDQNRVGKRWRVTITLNGSNVFRGIRTNARAERLVRGAPPARRRCRQPDRRDRKALSGGETCRASISF